MLFHARLSTALDPLDVASSRELVIRAGCHMAVVPHSHEWTFAHRATRAFEKDRELRSTRGQPTGCGIPRKLGAAPFAILHSLRMGCSNDTSVLVDDQTLFAYRDLWVPETQPAVGGLSYVDGGRV